MKGVLLCFFFLFPAFAGAQSASDSVRAYAKRDSASADSLTVIADRVRRKLTPVGNSDRLTARATALRKKPVVPVPDTVPVPPPPNGILLLPGMNLDSAAQANPAGTQFVIKAGVHVRQMIRPKNGQVFLFEKGAILDGQNTTLHAFHGYNAGAWTPTATLRGAGEIRNYANPIQTGAINVGDDRVTSTNGWVVESLYVHHNKSIGIRIGNRIRLRHNRVIQNGTIGVGGVSKAGLIEGNEIAWNNTNGVSAAACLNDPGFEGGGTKFVKTDSLVVRSNYVHDNCGPGLWSDINNINTIYEDNRVERNTREGIVVEVSYKTVIRNNQVHNNGGGDMRPSGWVWNAGIGVHASPNVEVYGNTLSGNWNGIVGAQQPRGPGYDAVTPEFGAYEVRNMYVHDNTVTQAAPPTGREGGFAGGAAQDDGSGLVFTTAWNNRWRNNTYILGTNPRPFAWANGARTLAEWRAYGQDATVPIAAPVGRARGFAAVGAPSCVTRLDSLDARYLVLRLDTLGGLRGVGPAARLEAATIARVNDWLARLTTQPACGGAGGTDTVIVTRVRTDTVRVGGTVSPQLVARIRVDLDSIDNDASAPAYSLRAQRRLKARVDSVVGGAVVIPVPVPPTNAAPVARFTSTVSAQNPLAYALDAAQSSDDKTVVGYAWDCGLVPNCAGTTARTTVTYPHGGPRVVRLIVRDAEGATSTATQTLQVAEPTTPPIVVPPVVTPDTTPPGAPPIRAELPRSVPAFTVPKAIRTVRVAAPMDFQAALNAAQPGDSLSVSGAWIGNFVLPSRSCGAQWIQIVGAAALPPAGTRVTPLTATGYPKIITPNSAPALTTANPTCGWSFVGLEISGTLAPTSIQYGLVTLGDGGWVEGGDTQTDLSKVPQRFILDRLFIHGTATLNTARCLALNSGAAIVRDSWLSDCHGKGFDSQALEGWNGPGPYLIENNHLAGAGENLMFGGADPGIAGLSPADITIRRNHFYKDPAWRGLWTIKNLFELKNARRVLVESNVFGPTWPGGQESAIVIKSSQDACGSCTWQGTQDVTFRYNLVRDAPVGLNLQAYDNSGQKITDVHTARVTVEQNQFAEIGAEGRGALMLLTHDLADVLISQNTFTHHASVGTARGGAVILAYGDGAARRMWYERNVMTAGAYGVFYDGGLVGTAALAAMGSGWRFSGNTVVGGAALAARFPAGNTFPATVPVGSGADLVELARRTAGVAITLPAAARPAVPSSIPSPRLTPADIARLARQPRSIP